jgi:hypothetical protein
MPHHSSGGSRKVTGCADDDNAALAFDETHEILVADGLERGAVVGCSKHPSTAHGKSWVTPTAWP